MGLFSVFPESNESIPSRANSDGLENKRSLCTLFIPQSQVGAGLWASNKSELE